jgi:phage tail-like protein
MAVYYPPVAFHFRVKVAGITGDGDMRFSEAGGLSVEVGTEEVPEGGQNHFVQKYPGHIKYPELVLKRGLLVGSAIHTWIKMCVEDFIIVPAPVEVALLNAEHQALMTWNLVNAYPTKWSVADLNAQNNTVAIETLQFYYQYFTIL